MQSPLFLLRWALVEGVARALREQYPDRVIECNCSTVRLAGVAGRKLHMYFPNIQGDSVVMKLGRELFVDSLTPERQLTLELANPQMLDLILKFVAREIGPWLDDVDL